MKKNWNYIAIKYSTNSQTGNWKNCDTKKEVNEYFAESGGQNSALFSTRKEFLSVLEKTSKEVGSGNSHMRGLFNAMLSAQKYFTKD